MTAGVHSRESAEPPIPAALPPIELTHSQRWYEERKRALLMAALPREFYQLAIEPGCGDGGITIALAERCSRVLSSDRDAEMVAACRARTRGLANVDVQVAHLPQDWPPEIADLIVLSEIGYHLEPNDFDHLVTRACAGLAIGGTLVAAHRRQTTEEFSVGGDDVHAHLFGRTGLSRIGGYADEELRIDVFVAEPQRF
jgi:SAM-dependent methyltransferase